ncbi:hypothetical protein FRB90_002736 [Tulasnella sp. 427]|nr:hypothetical protein FRB90_002736 [Tulasnella sp. 427]
MMGVLILQEVELGRQKNSLLPLHRLPVEILMTILLLVVREPDLNGFEHPGDHLYTLARVCTRWRDVVLTRPEFWQAVCIPAQDDGAYLEWVVKKNPYGLLRMYFSTRGEPFQDLRKPNPEQLQALERWQKLVFEGSHEDVVGKVLQRLELPTPRLTDLLIDLMSEDDFWIDPHAPSQQMQLADGPRLRYLSLRKVGIPWNSSRLRNLQALELAYINRNPPSAEQLHTILSACPQLWFLSLNQLVDRGSSTNSESKIPTGTVHLPRLTTLILQDIPEPIFTMVLSTISAPTCGWITIGTPPLRDLRKLEHRLTPLLARPLSSRPPIHYTYRHIEEFIGSLAISSEPSPKVPISSRWLFLEREVVGFEVIIRVAGDTDDDARDVAKWMYSITSPFQLPEELVVSCGWRSALEYLLGCYSDSQRSITAIRLRNGPGARDALHWIENRSTRDQGYYYDEDEAEFENDEVEALRFPQLDTLTLDVESSNMFFWLEEVRNFAISRQGYLHEHQYMLSQTGESSTHENPRYLTIEVPSNSVIEARNALQDLWCHVQGIEEGENEDDGPS